jgi:replication initiation protein RepC
MGRYQAAAAIAVIAAKRDQIRSPGGYLRGMTDRARDGELYLIRSLWGLAQRDRSRGTRAATQELSDRHSGETFTEPMRRH